MNKEKLKELGRFYLECFKVYFPLTKTKKEKLLNYLTELKDSYQKQIEKETGFNLGKIRMKEK